jgi:DNA primase
MARIPDNIIDNIIQTSRIEEVIGEFVNLKRAGSNLKGLSPFTDEKTPSFVVSPSKQIFKCFSTGKGGSVVTFLMEKEHYSYPEALKWLADKYGIELPKEEEQTAEQIAAYTERESLQIINEFARTHFQQNLHENDEGKAIGLSYFIERGFRKDIIEKFQLGYCLNSGSDFTDVAKQKGYKLELCEKVGLVKSKDERHFDFFRGRVIFPIHSITGRVLGFGARILGNDKKVAKYFNSPESIIYNKSEILYGLFFAKGDIIKYDNCYLVEGYTDVISLYQTGVTNVVSSSGTSLTKEQIKLIKRYTQNITILYDGDAAGIKASFRGIDLILEEGLNVNVVLFPDGDDPDSYSKKVSSSEFEEYIKTNKKDFISFKAELLLKDGGSDPLTRVKLVHEIIQSIALIPDNISRSIYSKEIAKRFDIDENVIYQELVKSKKKQLAKEIDEPEINNLLVENKNKSNQSLEANKTEENFHEEFQLIRFLIKFGTCAISIEENKESKEVCVAELICYELNRDELFFEFPLYNSIHQLIADDLSNNILNKASYFLRHENQEIVKLVSEIESNKYDLSSNWLKNYRIDINTEESNLKVGVLNAIYAFKSNKIQKRIKNIQQQITEFLSKDENFDVSDLISEQIVLETIKMKLSNQLGRTILH